ncbi:MAG: MBL fold metallo-hydrolase [Bacteriovoracaceae bacterium]|nr:MBL fold metallo-hydrolase [Bacteriovoracaceae bacterium]
MDIIYEAKKDDVCLWAFPVGELAANCTIIFSELTREAIIVDPGNDENEILDLVKENKLKPKMLIHTHAHFDHIGRSFELSQDFGAGTYLHQDGVNVYKTLANQSAIFGFQIGEVGEIENFFKEGDTILFNGSCDKLKSFMQGLKILHTPGHSPGSCCFFTTYFETPLLIAGDTLFQGSIGRTDLPGGSYTQLIDSIKTRLLTLPEETKTITGHGPMTTIGHESMYNQFLA